MKPILNSCWHCVRHFTSARMHSENMIIMSCNIHQPMVPCASSYISVVCWNHGKHTIVRIVKFADLHSLIAGFMGPTWGPSGTDRTHVGPMLAPWTLLSGIENSRYTYFTESSFMVSLKKIFNHLVCLRLTTFRAGTYQLLSAILQYLHS